MRIGIMGGTLDPVHIGHLQLAQAALEQLNLDRVMLLPAGDPPHKSNPTAKEDRLNMVRLAAEEAEGVFPCSLEIFRSGTTYTVDTLHWLRENNPNTEWFYIIGADTLEVLDTWRNFGDVAGLCTFVVNGRADEPARQARMEQLQVQYGAKFIPSDFCGPDISSTDIRGRIARGESTDELVPTTVGNYIKDHGLYLCARSKQQILTFLRENLKAGRYRHTLGVAETACRLAPRYGVDPARAELAALLHDCAKHLPLEVLRGMVIENVPDADAEELEAVSVLHAPAGAVMAKYEFGVKDDAILSAIRKHTLGDAQMSAMDALIYTADFVEPNREDFPGLGYARELAERDIFAAMCECARLTNAHLKNQGRNPHPRSLMLLKNYDKSK